MSKVIQYTGMADRKEFSAKDFERHGIEDQNKVVFEEKNDFTAEVSDAAWAFLSGDASGEKASFKDTEASEEPTDDDSTGDVESAADPASPEGSGGSGESIDTGGTSIEGADADATTATATPRKATGRTRTT